MNAFVPYFVRSNLCSLMQAGWSQIYVLRTESGQEVRTRLTIFQGPPISTRLAVRLEQGENLEQPDVVVISFRPWPTTTLPTLSDLISTVQLGASLNRLWLQTILETPLPSIPLPVVVIETPSAGTDGL